MRFAGFFREMKIPDLEQHRGKILLLSGVRIAFCIAVLLTTIVFQLKQSSFFNTESVLPIYFLLITAFVLDSIYLLFFEKFQTLWEPTAFLFCFDSVFITTLVFYTGVQQSIFLFMYLVNIILCAFVFHRRGAFLIAVFTSVCFSVLLILSPELQGQTLYYTVGVNNLAFFSVAGLSGYLSEQINFMGKELVLKKRDIKALRDLTKIIFENISSGLITVSSDFQILVSNKAANRILGVPLDGKSIDDLFRGMKEFILKNRGNKDSRFQREHRLSNGERIILGFSLSTLEDDRHGVDGYIIIFQDLTEIVRLEGAMRRQEKLAAVGKLAAGIAHEIRNPLASISGSIELLKSIMNLTTPDQVKLMDIMLKEIDRLNSLITEFLEFVRPDEKKLVVCSIDGILAEVLDVVHVNKDLPQNVKQVRRLNSSVFTLGDKNKLKQVFLNLVINAYQAMAAREKAVLEVTTSVENEHLVVRVRDTGTGMSEPTLKRLFEPFFTTKPKGTGLGLATAHKILEMHDAKIFVESHEGKGTEFTISFNQVIKRGAHSNEGQNTGS